MPQKSRGRREEKQAADRGGESKVDRQGQSVQQRAKGKAEDGQREDAADFKLPAAAALIALFGSIAARYAYNVHETNRCWDSFHTARAGIASAAAVPNESVLAWAQRHGAHVQSGEVWLRDGPLRGLSVAPSQDRPDSIVLRVPHALALFYDPLQQAELDCLQTNSSHEKKMAGLTLTLLAEYREYLRNASAWTPYFQQLPSLKQFDLHPFRSPEEELQRFQALPLAQAVRVGIAEFNATYLALTQRSPTCLPNHLRNISHDEYWWARMIIRTRFLAHVRVCNHDLAALVPVMDLINHAEPTKTTMAKEWMKHDSNIADKWIELSVEPTLASGDEITFSYSLGSNTLLAFVWGFMLPNNPESEVPLSLEVCLQIQEAACVNNGCFFAKLRDEACKDTLQRREA